MFSKRLDWSTVFIIAILINILISWCSWGVCIIYLIILIFFDNIVSIKSLFGFYLTLTLFIVHWIFGLANIVRLNLFFELIHCLFELCHFLNDFLHKLKFAFHVILAVQWILFGHVIVYQYFLRFFTYKLIIWGVFIESGQFIS